MVGDGVIASKRSILAGQHSEPGAAIHATPSVEILHAARQESFYAKKFNEMIHTVANDFASLKRCPTLVECIAIPKGFSLAESGQTQKE